MFKKLILLSLLSTIIKASCPNESLEWQNNCYFFQNETIGFAAAEIECVGKNGHLVSIHDRFTDTLLAQEGGIRFQQSTVTNCWIGLTNMMPSGNWAWMDGTLLNFTDWANGEPQNVTGNNCAGLSIVDGYWRSEDCFKPKPYICKVDKSFYDPPTTTTVGQGSTTTKYPSYANCPYPFIYFQPTHSCYGVGNLTSPLNWEIAEKYCLGFDAHLVSIHSQEEAAFLGYNVYVADLVFWTGAFSNDGGTTWKWSDESSWDYNPFPNGYPSLHQSACGKLFGSTIADINCNTKLRPICKKNL